MSEEERFYVKGKGSCTVALFFLLIPALCFWGMLLWKLVGPLFLE